MADYKDLEGVMGAVKRVADAIAAPAGPGTDACGGAVESLTESVMGVTAGLVRIAEAIESLADAVRECANRGQE